MKNHNHKNVKRCTYSGKNVENKDVLLPEYAIEYVKKLNYVVIPISEIKIKNISILMIMVFFVLVGIQSAYSQMVYGTSTTGLVYGEPVTIELNNKDLTCIEIISLCSDSNIECSDIKINLLCSPVCTKTLEICLKIDLICNNNNPNINNITNNTVINNTINTTTIIG